MVIFRFECEVFFFFSNSDFNSIKIYEERAQRTVWLSFNSLKIVKRWYQIKSIIHFDTENYKDRDRNDKPEFEYIHTD